jgi:hypothetical protein
MTELFGFVPDKPGEHYVSREEYKGALQKVEKEYSIEQGDEDYLTWILLLLGRSPKFDIGYPEVCEYFDRYYDDGTEESIACHNAQTTCPLGCPLRLTEEWIKIIQEGAGNNGSTETK